MLIEIQRDFSRTKDTIATTMYTFEIVQLLLYAPTDHVTIYWPLDGTLCWERSYGLKLGEIKKKTDAVSVLTSLYHKKRKHSFIRTNQQKHADAAIDLKINTIYMNKS
jgi:hypothetical protein